MVCFVVAVVTLSSTISPRLLSQSIKSFASCVFVALEEFFSQLAAVRSRSGKGNGFIKAGFVICNG